MSVICLRRFPGEHRDRSSTQDNDAVQYRDLIGKGAHGIVYEIYDSIKQTVLARKLFEVDGGSLPHYIENELRAVKQFREHGIHKNVVEVYDNGMLETNQYFIDMERCQFSLDKHICQLRCSAEAPNVKRMWKTILFIMDDITMGVETIHRCDLVHRDIKPSNSRPTVLFSSWQSDLCWKIGDFGLTRSGGGMSSTVHDTEDAYGTPGYRAPELLGPHPNFSKKVDIWGLGCVLYELVFHKPPFRNDYETCQYAAGVKLCFPESNLLVNPTGRRYFIQLIDELLHVDASMRPSAGGLLRKLDELQNTLMEPLDRHETEYGSQRVGISRNSQRFQEPMPTSSQRKVQNIGSKAICPRRLLFILVPMSIITLAIIIGRPRRSAQLDILETDLLLFQPSLDELSCDQASDPSSNGRDLDSTVAPTLLGYQPASQSLGARSYHFDSFYVTAQDNIPRPGEHYAPEDRCESRATKRFWDLRNSPSIWKTFGVAFLIYLVVVLATRGQIRSALGVVILCLGPIAVESGFFVREILLSAIWLIVVCIVVGILKAQMEEGERVRVRLERVENALREIDEREQRWQLAMVRLRTLLTT